MSKKVYIDCQSFQTEAWDRGMGRYTMSLLGSMYKQNSDIDYVLIFSKNLLENEPAVQALHDTLPKAHILTLDLLPTVKDGYKHASKHNADLIRLYINENDSSNDIFFLIPSLFQEPTASVFPDNVRKGLIYYDAIPYLYYHRYKNAINYQAYMERHETLYEADVIFTISQTIADDLLVFFGISDSEKRHIVNIDGACSEDMFEAPRKPKNAPKGEYILLPSSSDIRKNNRNAVRAFEQLRSLTNKDYKLVITSTFNKGQREQLSNISTNIIFTGNISQNELAWLYNNAKVIFFASEYEGLGLPVLESVRAGKPVACSNIAVFREISEDAFYFFDPLDVQEMTLKLYEAIDGKGWQRMRKYYQKIDKRYQWNRTSTLVLNEVSEFTATKSTAPQPKPKIAIVGPTPSGYSAIGKVIQELHDVTTQIFNVDYFFEENKGDVVVDVRPNLVKYLANCFDIKRFNAKLYATYDTVIYHVGNSEYHINTILNALYLPGIVIFHDTSLKEVYGEMVRLGYITLERYEAEGRLNELLSAKKSAFIGSITNGSLTGVTHSRYAQKAIKSIVIDEGVEITRAELPTVVPSRNVYSQKRRKIHIGLAGVLTGNKGIDIIKSIALEDSITEDIVLHVFGFNFVEPEIVEELSIYKNVKLMTDLSDLDYQAQLANLDVLVNFRTEYRGETSLTVLEAMRYGCVVIVNGSLGWFSELPDKTVVKISTREQIIPAIKEIIVNPTRRKLIAESARIYIKNAHSPEKYIKMLLEAVNKKGDTNSFKQRSALIDNNTLSSVLKSLGEEDGRNG